MANHLTVAVPWKFLSDEAVKSSDQDRFRVHSAYAKVLYQVAQTCDTPFSIALYSSWGTGKSSVCNLVQELSAKDKTVHYVYLDVWKYSNEPLKRWVLFETERSLTKQGVISDYKFGGRSLQSHLEFEESWEDQDKVKVNYRAVGWLGLAVVLFICIFLASLFFSPPASYSWRILTTASAFLAAGGAAAFLLEAVIKEIFKSLSGMVFERNVKHVSAKPAFSSEKFGEIFEDLIRRATSSANDSGKRIIFVFDNLDRCPEEIAIEAIGVIKTYLDQPGCIYIIPCDEAALMKHITKSYISQEDGETERKEEGRKYAREFLNKFFQVTIRLPIAPEFDIETFLDEQLKLAGMNDLPADARDVLVLGYLGQTPRQIKRELNDLTAYRSLAVQAEAEGLVEIGALTSNLSLLTKMSVISVEWPNFLEMLSNDPELWADIIDKISDGAEVKRDGIDEGLLSFLRATRHVSSNADIRPFIYLKRVAYERNIAVATAVQNSLRAGEAKAFLDLLAAAKSPSEKEEIVRVATDQARHWLEAVPPREVFLKNSVSVLLRAAGQVTGFRLLELMVSRLLEFASSETKAIELAEVVPLPDLFAFSPTISTIQKERCLEKIASVFDSGVPFGKNHLQYWRQFLDHEDQLPATLRSYLAAKLEARYQSNESEALQLLFEASQRMGGRVNSQIEWAASPSVLATVASKVTLLGDEVDQLRISVLKGFKFKLGEEARGAAANAIAAALQGARTRSFDAQAQAAIGFLADLSPAIIGQPYTNAIAAPLVEQVNSQGNFKLKAPWLATLILLRGSLPPESQKLVDDIYRPLLLDVPDPAGVVQLLAGMTPAVCGLMLAVPENIQALHDQPQRMESKYGTTASQYREQILNCFPSSGLIAEPTIWDETRTWDLVLFLGLLRRGKSEGVAAEVLQIQILGFVERFLKGRVTSQAAVLDQLLAATKENPEMLDEPGARALSECCIEVLGVNVEKYFADLRFLSTKLSKLNRLWLARELVRQFVQTHQAQWIQVLQKLSEDIVADPDLSADKALVNDLMDHSFEAARVSPSEASGILVVLFPQLDSERASDYIDEAQDRLISLDSSGSQMPQMEPYLAMLRSAQMPKDQPLPQKLATFCDRMLGTAKPEEERNAILSFLKDLGLRFVDRKLAERVIELAPKDDPLAAAARTAVEQLVPPGTEPASPNAINGTESPA